MAELISVILPVYNGEKYIKEAVDSILNQTYQNFEFLIINDASTDNTTQILNSYNDSRIKIINNQINLKVVKCLNLGLKLAKGNFIARMDADDIAFPDRFEVQLDYFHKNPAIDVLGSYAIVFGDLNFTLRTYEHHDNIKASLLFLNTITHPTVMFKKASFFGRNLFYDEAFVNAEDYGMWIEAMDTMKFAIVPHPLLKYRIHDDNVSVKKLSNWEVLKSMNFMAYKKIFQKMGLAVNSDELELHLHLGFNHTENLQQGHYKKYVSWLAKIVAHNKASGYFDTQALRNQILHKIIFVTRNYKITASDVVFLIKNLIALYSIKDYAAFFKYRSKYIVTLKN